MQAIFSRGIRDPHGQFVSKFILGIDFQSPQAIANKTLLYQELRCCAHRAPDLERVALLQPLGRLGSGGGSAIKLDLAGTVAEVAERKEGACPREDMDRVAGEGGQVCGHARDDFATVRDSNFIVSI